MMLYYSAEQLLGNKENVKKWILDIWNKPFYKISVQSFSLCMRR